MSATFLTTLSIVLIEIIAILLILLTILFLRFRKLKSSLKKYRTPVDTNTGPTEKTVPFLVHLKDEINRITDRIEEDSEQDRATVPGLCARLDHLNKELHIANQLKNAPDNTDYWQLIQDAYTCETPIRQDSGSDVHEGREAFYLARIKNLEAFKEMFFNTQAKLKESFDTIDALKHKISEMPSTEENAQLEEMIDKLSIDNIGLNKQLTSANQELNNILSDSLADSDSVNSPGAEANNEAADLREENDFLASQIQYLLQQELEKTDQMQEKIIAIEQALQEKTDECDSLKASNENDNAESTHEINSDSDYASLQEENEFLSNQIQYLLTQELEAANKMQQRLDTMEADLQARETELEALNNTSEAAQPETEDLSKKLASIEEENEFLTSQIQHLLSQELEATNKMQRQLDTMETNLRAREAEIEALKNSPEAAQPETEDLSKKLASIEEENEFLTSQIQHLLSQELEATNKIQQQISSMETDLRFKEAEIDALKNKRATVPATEEDSLSLKEKLESIEEENEFLTSQIQYLLQQELEATQKMQDKIASMDILLSEKQAECDALKNADSPGMTHINKALNEKLKSTEDENSFLASQIQQLLKQELAYSQNMQQQMKELKISLMDKETEYEILKAQSNQTSDNTEIQELNSKIQSIEEENEFLVSQIQHLLAQEVERSQDMLEQIQSLEKEPDINK